MEAKLPSNIAYMFVDPIQWYADVQLYVTLFQTI